MKRCRHGFYACSVCEGEERDVKQAAPERSNCPHGVDLGDCLACPFTAAEQLVMLDRWRREITEWHAIALELVAAAGGAAVVASEVTREQGRRMAVRGERPVFESARARRMLESVPGGDAGGLDALAVAADRERAPAGADITGLARFVHAIATCTHEQASGYTLFHPSGRHLLLQHCNACGAMAVESMGWRRPWMGTRAIALDEPQDRRGPPMANEVNGPRRCDKRLEAGSRQCNEPATLFYRSETTGEMAARCALHHVVPYKQELGRLLSLTREEYEAAR